MGELEAIAAEQATPSDQLGGWLKPPLARALLERGISNLGELQALISHGGRWWTGPRACGPIKAARLERQIEQLLGAPSARTWTLHFGTEGAASLSGAHGSNRAEPGSASIAGADDRVAIQAWVAARAGSVLTAKAYEREADRFILWCVLERRKALSSAVAENCRAYTDFLADVPASWISRRHVPRLAPGWAPFAGPLPSTALQATVDFLAHRGADFTTAPDYMPLLGLIADTVRPMSYPALHKAFKRFLKRALARTDLPSDASDAMRSQLRPIG